MNTTRLHTYPASLRTSLVRIVLITFLILFASALSARLLIIQIPSSSAPPVDFEFGPLEPGSVALQGLNDLGESVSGISLPAVGYSRNNDVATLSFKLWSPDGKLARESVVSLAATNPGNPGKHPLIPGKTMQLVRFTFEPLDDPIHSPALEIEAVNLGDTQLYLGATKKNVLVPGRLIYQGEQMFSDQDLRVQQLRTVNVWRLLAELRHTGPTGFAAVLALGGSLALAVATMVASQIPTAIRKMVF